MSKAILQAVVSSRIDAVQSCVEGRTTSFVSADMIAGLSVFMSNYFHAVSMRNDFVDHVWYSLSSWRVYLNAGVPTPSGALGIDITGLDVEADQPVCSVAYRPTRIEAEGWGGTWKLVDKYKPFQIEE